jgi:hypothetical protein
MGTIDIGTNTTKLALLKMVRSSDMGANTTKLAFLK